MHLFRQTHLHGKEGLELFHEKPKEKRGSLAKIS